MCANVTFLRKVLGICIKCADSCDVFCTVGNFMMFVVDAIGDHIMEAYSSIVLLELYILRVMSPCACPT